ncbi:MAG: SpoIIE family protein phosphatase [Spirochaetales bacterium]|nr:SpoIIE family protein phosphatase [Spirochaetales bacterium]
MQKKNTRKPEVLIIEPDSQLALQLSRSFLRLGYPSHIAASGEEGIRYIETEASPIVFLDARLPVMSGVEILNLLYSIQPMCQVIFLIEEQNLREIMGSITGRIPNFLFKPLADELIEIAIRKAEQNYLLDKEKSMYLESLERDLRIAARIQKQLSRQEKIHMDGLLFHSVTRPGKEYLNGDFCYFYQLADDRLLIILGDISGSGVTAALISREVQWLMETHYRSSSTPSQLLQIINNALIDKLGNCSLSVMAAILHTTSAELEYCICGTPMPVLMHADGSHQFLPHSNQVIGVLKDMDLRTARARVEKGQMLFLFTNGLLELGMGQQGAGAMDEVFESVHRSLQPITDEATFEQEFQKLLHRLENVHLREGFSDDIAMAVIKLLEP